MIGGEFQSKVGGRSRVRGGGLFKVLGQVLHRTNYDCLAVLHNILGARQVGGWLGKFIN